MENTFDRERIAALMFKSLNQTLSPEEEQTLEAWKSLQPENRALFDELTDPERLRHELQQLAAVEAAIEAKLGWHEAHLPEKKIRKLYTRWSWAAAILLLLSVGAYVWLKPAKQQVAEVIHPGGNKAVLTLADGSLVTLDSAGNQVIAQGKASIHQQGGQLTYEGAGSGDNAGFNKLSTPAGGQFKVQLPDGSTAWLNAASSIRYPVVFSGKERQVEVTGEVFFDVAQQADKPFKVIVNKGVEINVLGTQFNINAYNDRPFVSTTLIQGKVSVSKNGHPAILQPGEQALTDKDTRVIKNIDVDKVMAWKNGMFNFEDVSLQEAMGEIERWYDVKVIYENGVPDIPFSGKISRDTNLNDLLKVLGETALKFRLEPGRRLVITK
ncbi:FecR family protein [Chitinophaga arvensicola]|uniref:Ferric-dicitrate binding protein FerR, regulates iron transport through sigma-19 n=1 Tax=Chitinophaga arvensicola TaxID=29529 RepID=A0A1I0PKU2_9BACT|nr:FecR family protein [Chitinophaga arvensicola]SEW14982.1 ferric-dicitrate binding protein FerR, regulates iron transport through sigma-19 [Chitinophaga arvensicola]